MIFNRSLSTVVLVLVCAMSLSALRPTSAWAETVTFDDVDASAGDVAISSLNPYQGYSWTNFYITTTTPGFPGFNNGIVSGTNAAYSGGQTNSGGTISPVIGSIQSTGGLFDFTSADLGSGYYNDLSLTVEGSKNGTVLFDQTVTVNTTGAQLFNFDFTGIDTLSFSASTGAGTSDPYQCGSFDCTQFTVDNLTVGPATSVPTPGPVPLILSGLGALALRARRLKSAAARGEPCTR
jgi:hypothetical protein